MNSGLSKKLTHKVRPVTSIENLRGRVERLLQHPSKQSIRNYQLALALPDAFCQEDTIDLPTKSITSFLDFLTDALPDGDAYLFGGVLRDLALLGGRGFNSDIDVVVEGDWSGCRKYLDRLGAIRNKFGGYRLEVAAWKIDIWSARETWAIRQGLIQYNGIGSLTETTVLNWDAILMNWRTRAFIFRQGYFDEIQARILDIVLEQNPDPLGMVVRVFRHLCLKDAKSVTSKALIFLANATATYGLQALTEREIKSYGMSVIDPAMYRFFQHVKANEHLEIACRAEIAGEMTKAELGEIPLLS
jgi:hypothetical protein